MKIATRLLALILPIVLFACTPATTQVPPTRPPTEPPAGVTPSLPAATEPIPDGLVLLCDSAEAASGSGEQVCRSEVYRFELQYPSAGLLRDQAVQHARVDLPFTPGTNLLEKYMEISVTENAATCLSPLGAGYAPDSLSTEQVQVNGIDFLKEQGSDAGAGNLYAWTGYSTTRGDVCVSLGFVLHSHNPELDPTPPPVFDTVEESQVFENIVSTFLWR